jgi:hypothetical protein
LTGAEAAAEAGETVLLPGGAGPENLVDRSLFDSFLMLRSRRCDIAAAAKAAERVLDLSEGVIRAIEADRYRISDPMQQGRFLTDRTLFYQMAAFSAFKLKRWDSVVRAFGGRGGGFLALGGRRRSIGAGDRPVAHARRAIDPDGRAEGGVGSVEADRASVRLPTSPHTGDPEVVERSGLSADRRTARTMRTIAPSRFLSKSRIVPLGNLLTWAA